MTTTSRADTATAGMPSTANRAAAGVRPWVAFASALPGAIHLAVAPGHFEGWWVHGTFFVAVGCFQLVFAALMLRGTSWHVALTGVVVNLGVVMTYVASRTTGLPIQPPPEATTHMGAHLSEGVGAADLTATGSELVVVFLLVTLLPPRLRRATVNVLLATGAGLWVLRLSGALG